MNVIRQPQRGDVVFVEWVDSEAADGWTSIRSVLKDDELIVKTVSWVLAWGTRTIVLAGSLDIENETVSGHIAIPVCAINDWRLLDV